MWVEAGKGVIRSGRTGQKAEAEERSKIMALKFKFNSKEEVPAALAEHYVERDGAFVLDVVSNAF